MRPPHRLIDPRLRRPRPAALAATALALLGLLAGPAPASAACHLTELAELPVTLVGLRPLVPVVIDGKPVLMLADSGALLSMLSPRAATRLGLKSQPSGLEASGVGGRTGVDLTDVRQLQIGALSLSHVPFMVTRGFGSPGALGQDVLGQTDVEYDLPHGVIRLMRAHDCDRAALAYWAHDRPVSILELDRRPYRSRLAVPVEEQIVAQQIVDAGNDLAISTVQLNGTRVRALLDTGMPVTTLSLAAAKRAGIRHDENAGRMMMGVGGGTAQSWSAAVATLGVGGEQIRNTHLHVATVEPGGFGLFLGADFFLAHRVYVANSQHRVYFTYEGGPVFDRDPSP